jgi:Lysylphosphatidylglycerol synthase TM region
MEARSCLSDIGPARCQRGLSVPKVQSLTPIFLRSLAAFLGFGLLAVLVHRSGPGIVWRQVQAVGWGLAVIIILGGVSQLIKTWAWRSNFRCDISGLSWPHCLGAQLMSDAAGQLGVAGKLVGEGMRVSLSIPAVPLPNAISSCAIDGGLHVLTASGVTVCGIAATLLIAPFSGVWRLYAWLVSAVLVALVILASVAVARRWQLMGNTARAIGRLPWLHNWINNKQLTIDSAEHNLLTFHQEAPAAFWTSLSLNVLWHALAILEVYIILRFVGARIAVAGALIVEGLTKVINLVGALNPGNLGTYEGGNMLIAKMFGVTGTTGLTLALCRRARALFWAGVGVMCMIVMKKAKQYKGEATNASAEYNR